MKPFLTFSAVLLGFANYSLASVGVSCVSEKLVAAAFCSCNIQDDTYYGRYIVQPYLNVLMCDGSVKPQVSLGAVTYFSYGSDQAEKARQIANANNFCGNMCGK